MIQQVVSGRLVTHADDDKVQAGPHAGEVSEEAEGHPLEEHLDGEEDGEDHVDHLEDEHELLVVLQVDVLEAEGEAGGEDEEEDGPLEEGVVHHVVDDPAELVPPGHQRGVVQAVGPQAPGEVGRMCWDISHKVSQFHSVKE